ncbi:alkylated DNA repair protein alkB homolog 8 isoform X2 [Prorops nasuta]|uniref:alkylated DNA repair protein alkB homolog 8 isoform X2 n=1 Tax=Prorops nasuta TaxID=863751 RepID=UPI0034CDD384
MYKMITENLEQTNTNKSLRKQRRAYHKVTKDMNIICSESPTKYLMICNAGLVTGLQRETLESLLNPIINNYDIVMLPAKSYCFIKTNLEDDAVIAYNTIHNKVKINEQKTPLYAVYIEAVPFSKMDEWNPMLPPGLSVLKDFITEEEELKLLNTLNWSKEESISSELKHRKVRHYGYEFQYGTNKVDPDSPIDPIPKSYNFLQELFKTHKCAAYEFDQLTINFYLPGQGIPPHIDTHGIFEDTILSLSLGSSCVMDFKQRDRKVPVFLPERSLLVMNGESRYAWSHGICPRHNDLVPTQKGFTTQSRGSRISFTFRKVRRGDCNCNFLEYCNRLSNTSLVPENTASSIEAAYVHKVYEEISNHFNDTRHSKWPKVANFLESLNKGELVLDVGCGNGKYLQGDPQLYKMGCDRSSGLAQISHERGCQVLLCDCLHLPYKDSCLDAIICIAVIHHFSTKKRRISAISEMIRLLRPNGKCLIYVWAKEQKKDSVKSTYLKYGQNKIKPHLTCMKTVEQGLVFPVHENRTEFTYSDMLVPWKRKGGGDFLRYYHVFEEGELVDLCSQVPSINIKEVYYDQGNWCVILEKQ